VTQLSLRAADAAVMTVEANEDDKGQRSSRDSQATTECPNDRLSLRAVVSSGHQLLTTQCHLYD